MARFQGAAPTPASEILTPPVGQNGKVVGAHIGEEPDYDVTLTNDKDGKPRLLISIPLGNPALHMTGSGSATQAAKPENIGKTKLVYIKGDYGVTLKGLEVTNPYDPTSKRDVILTVQCESSRQVATQGELKVIHAAREGKGTAARKEKVRELNAK